MLTLVTPAFNEEQNLPHLYEQIVAALEPLGVAWEWVVVDDHSCDGTFTVLQKLAETDARVRAVRLARNAGSHTALYCGLTHARGDCAVVLAADLQDPPSTIPALLEEWKKGTQIVWAARAARHGESRRRRAFAGLYYWIMRRIVGIRDIPAAGADFFLVDRRVIEALRLFPETNVSLLALLTWMGFKQGTITYEKQARQHGRSGWTLGKKLKLVIDSVTSFSFVPIRVMSVAGFIVALLGFAYALVVVFNYLFIGKAAEGWSSLMVVVLVLGGMQMMMMGVLGEYLGRALDEGRRRPRYLIESTTKNWATDQSAIPH